MALFLERSEAEAECGGPTGELRKWGALKGVDCLGLAFEAEQIVCLLKHFWHQVGDFCSGLCGQGPRCPSVAQTHLHTWGRPE